MRDGKSFPNYNFELAEADLDYPIKSESTHQNKEYTPGSKGYYNPGNTFCPSHSLRVFLESVEQLLLRLEGRLTSSRREIMSLSRTRLQNRFGNREFAQRVSERSVFVQRREEECEMEFAAGS